MDAHIGNLLDEWHEDYKKGPETIRSKAVIDIVLQTNLPSDTKSHIRTTRSRVPHLCNEVDPLVCFSLAYDSTNGTTCRWVYLLSKNPLALARILAEHVSVFGTDVADVSLLLISWLCTWFALSLIRALPGGPGHGCIP
jgi:hypothetical protein